jgi:hypothetical protein
MKRLAFVAAFVSILSLGVQLSSRNAYAAGKVNCDQVMSEINSGKTVAEVAKDMGVSRRGVRRCRRHHPEGESKMGGATATAPGATARPSLPVPAAPAP